MHVHKHTHTYTLSRTRIHTHLQLLAPLSKSLIADLLQVLDRLTLSPVSSPESMVLSLLPPISGREVAP